MEERAEGGVGEVVAERRGRGIDRRGQLEELRKQLRMPFHHRIELGSSPEVAACLIPPGVPGHLARRGRDGPVHHEDQLVRLLVRRQAAQLLDLLAGIRRSKPLHPFALKGEAPAVLPRHDIAPLLAPRLAEVLRLLEALAGHQPQTEALEVERRELLEGERVRGAGQDGLGHGVVEQRA